MEKDMDMTGKLKVFGGPDLGVLDFPKNHESDLKPTLRLWVCSLLLLRLARTR